MTKDPNELYIDGIKIKKTGNFTEDSIIDQDGYLEIEIMKRVYPRRKVIGVLNSVLQGKEKELSFHIKKQVIIQSRYLGHTGKS